MKVQIRCWKLFQLFIGEKKAPLKSYKGIDVTKYLLFSIANTRLSNLYLAETSCNYIDQSKAQLAHTSTPNKLVKMA